MKPLKEYLWMLSALVEFSFLPFMESAENTSRAYVNQSSFHNCEILVINWKLTYLTKQIIPRSPQLKPRNKGASKTQIGVRIAQSV